MHCWQGLKVSLAELLVVEIRDGLQSCSPFRPSHTSLGSRALGQQASNKGKPNAATQISVVFQPPVQQGPHSGAGFKSLASRTEFALGSPKLQVLRSTSLERISTTVASGIMSSIHITQSLLKPVT